MNFDEIFECCIDKIDNWKSNNLKPSDLKSNLYFSMTNKVYKIENIKKVPPYAVIFRVFSKTDKIINLDLNSTLFKACAHDGIGPQILYDQTPKYRIEEFLEGRVLTFLELNNKLIIESFARKICDFHYNSALKKILIEKDSRNPFVMNVFDTWINTFKSEYSFYLSRVTTPRNKFIMEQLSYILTDEFKDNYFELLPKGAQEVVASHNDILENNIILINNDRNKLYIIDYEYTHLNFRAYDLSLYLLESKFDYTNSDFPFFAYYEEACLTEHNFDYLIEAYLDHYFKNYYSGKKQYEEYMNDETPILKDEVIKLEPINVIIWGIWAILVIDWENLDENCYNFEFSFHKLELFKKLRSRINLKTKSNNNN